MGTIKINEKLAIITAFTIEVPPEWLKLKLLL